MPQRREIRTALQPASGPRIDTRAFVALVAFLAIALLTGGGSRVDVQSHLILRPVAVLFGAYACLQMRQEAFRAVRAPVIFLLILAGIILAQLIPLPPALWASLPGGEIYTSAAEIFGIEQGWHALTVSPAQTRNSLVALFPPLAALLLFAIASPARRGTIVVVLLLLLGMSAILGLAQRTGPAGGALYLYRITNETSAVGFFANRNHQAAMLACMFPMLASFASLPSENPKFQRYKNWIAIGAAAVIVPLILVTGSRSGLVLALIGITAAGFLYRRPSAPSSHSQSDNRSRRSIRAWLVIGIGATLMATITLVFSQAEAINRFLGSGLASDLRVRVFPSLLEMAKQAFPTGIGFGAFEPAYRAIEPDEMLNRGYLNNAHNDLLQLIIEGGLPAVLLLLAFLYWLIRGAVAVWFRVPRVGTSVQLARLGSVIIAILLIASFVDYPLRTPFVMVVFAIATAWLSSATTGAAGQTAASPPPNGVAAEAT